MIGNTEVAVRLDQLIARFAQLDQAEIGYGPFHPQSPNESIRKELVRFLAEHRFFLDDLGYSAFLERYCGAVVNDHASGIVIDLSGLAGVSLDFVATPGSVVDDDGIGVFGSAERTELNPATKLKQTRYAYFGFDATGQRPKGVYCCAHTGSEEPTEWRLAYPSFLDWLEAVVNTRGLVVPKE